MPRTILMHAHGRKSLRGIGILHIAKIATAHRTPTHHPPRTRNTVIVVPYELLHELFVIVSLPEAGVSPFDGFYRTAVLPSFGAVPAE